MVSQQATKSPRARGLLSHQICNDFIGRGTSVDIVAYKNEFVLNVASALPAEVKEGPELVIEPAGSASLLAEPNAEPPRAP